MNYHSLTLLQGHSQDTKHGPPESLHRLLRGERRRKGQERRDDEDHDEVGENQKIPVDDITFLDRDRYQILLSQ